MSHNTSVTIGEHLNSFVRKQVCSGRFGSASEVVRAGLRLLEEQEAKLESLRAALVEGEQSGPAAPFDVEEFLAEMKARESDDKGHAPTAGAP